MPLPAFIGRILEAIGIARQFSPVPMRGGGWMTVWEPWSGAWQRNIEVDRTAVLAYHTVYACITLIASDISKLRVRLVEQDDDGIWTETDSPAFSPVLRKPNSFQTRNQFWEYWMLSKLTAGNTYALKERDQRNVVTALYVLDPKRVQPLIADDGSVFYELWSDYGVGLQQMGETVRVPAREIIHDRFNCIFHPLIGTSPILACGLAATQGLQIQENSALFFGNKSMPGGVLTAPGAVKDETAERLKAKWELNYSGANAGRVAVLADGLKFEPITMSAQDSQLIEQLRFTAEVICSCFHVPPYKVGVGPMPTNNNIQALNLEYYSQCLQSLIEAAEECLDEGLGIGWAIGMGTDFDVENLLRMDTATQVDVLGKSIRAGFMAPNEARRRLDLEPVQGGATPYMQQQNFSLAALDRRDSDQPFARTPPMPPARPSTDSQAQVQAGLALAEIRRGLS